jgi:hypothetical protein
MSDPDCTEVINPLPVVKWFPNLSGADTRQVPDDLYHFWILNDGQGNLLSYRAAHFELVKLDENGAETVVQPGENGAFPRESVDLQTGLISQGYALRLRPELEIPQDRPLPDRVIKENGHVDLSLMNVQVGWATQNPRARWEPSREGFTTAIDGAHYSEFVSQILAGSDPSLREQMIADFIMNGGDSFPYRPVLDNTGNILIQSDGMSIWTDQNGQEISKTLENLITDFARLFDTRQGAGICQTSLAQNPEMESVLNVLSIAIDRIESMRPQPEPTVAPETQNPQPQIITPQL